MGGAKLMDNNAERWYGSQPKRADNAFYMHQEETFTNKTVSFDCETFEYKDCATSCIGNGSFGCVFRGIENKTGRAVAIKRMPRVSLKQNEIKVMKAVKSDYLVGLVDIYMNDQEDCMYIVMELCDIDLDRHLKYHTIDGTLSSHDLRRLIDNITRGYNALYECYIVHRDIKPQNILIKYSAYGQNLFDTAKISDFGISRILSDEDHEALSNVAGTLYYMAPEVGANILKTCEYGQQVDMWSLGCVFYQCITGKIPFDEREMCRMFLFAACNNYEAYDKPVLPAGTDEDIVRLVNALLEIDSTKRTTPHCLYNEVCKWIGDRRYSNDCSYADDSSSCRSSYSTIEFDEIY